MAEGNKAKKSGPRRQSQKSTSRIHRNLDSLIDKEQIVEEDQERKSANEMAASAEPGVSRQETIDEEEEDVKDDVSTDASGIEDDEDDSAAEELLELLQMTKKSNDLASRKQLF